MITAEQIRVAREMLGWSQSMLAKRARRAVCTVNRAETGTLHESLTNSVNQSIQHAFEQAGVEFLTQGQPGVRLRKEVGGAGE